MSLIKKHRLAAGGLALLAAAVVVTGLAAVPTTSEPSSTYGYLKLFTEVLALVRGNYVDQVDDQDLMKGAYEGLLAALDGESEYLTARDYQAMKRPRPNGEGGVGVSLTRRDGVLFVTSVTPGSDAAKKGLRLGDQLRRVGDLAGRALTLTQAERALLGPAGSKVTVSVSRRDEPRREDVELVREVISPSMPSLDKIEDGVAVVGIPSFTEGSAGAFQNVLGSLTQKNIHKLVLDLRGNTKGTPEEAARAASLLTGGGVVARLEGRDGAVSDLKADGPKAGFKGEILLLTDPGTAFTAEIFTAALLDAGVAKQAGEQTLGRAGEREILPLANGDFLYLTVRKYVSASGRTWHGEGLKPTVSIPRDMDAPVADRDNIQLEKAVEWLRDQDEEAKAA